MCTWLNRNYSCSVDFARPATLAAAVADGVLLCQLAADISGNTKLRYTATNPNVFQVNENVNAFLTQCEGMGISGLAPLSA
jgi:hypothetical protein